MSTRLKIAAGLSLWVAVAALFHAAQPAVATSPPVAKKLGRDAALEELERIGVTVNGQYVPPGLTLAQILANGASTNGTALTSPNGTGSTLDLENAGATGAGPWTLTGAVTLSGASFTANVDSSTSRSQTAHVWTGHGGGSCSGNPYAWIRQEAAAGADGGDLTQATWNDRSFTHGTGPAITAGYVTWVVGTATVIKVQPGTYVVRARAVGYQVGPHQIRLKNTTTGSDVRTVVSADSTLATGGNTESTLEARFSCTTEQQLRLQHNCTTSNSGDGGGNGSNLEIESFAEVWVERVGLPDGL